uniref:hypothetical protein n=1 Tax=uncultured Bacteroides sp. TaxID=162156 RepID=UPI0025FC456B
LVFQKRCKGRAFFNIMQIYAAIFLHFYCIFFAFVANMQKNRHVAKHTFHNKSRIDRFYIPYYNIFVCKIRHEYHLNLSIHALFHYQSIGLHNIFKSIKISSSIENTHVIVLSLQKHYLCKQKVRPPTKTGSDAQHIKKNQRDFNN